MTVAPKIHRYSKQVLGFTENCNGAALEMVLIPAGVFCMGAAPDEQGDEDEKPQHLVTIPQPFLMGRYPVTQAQWRAVANLEPVALELNPDPSRFKGENRPVENVSWRESLEFCARLSRETGKNYRLPSEAEWEYACRAVSGEQLSDIRLQISDDSQSIWREWISGKQRHFSEREEAEIITLWNRYFYQPFHFGPTLSTEVANYDGNYTYGAGVEEEYRQETVEVGAFGAANAFGLSDLHGNVWEWCLDPWHNSYENASKDGGVWDEGNESLYQNILKNMAILLKSDKNRVIRGGSWYLDSRNCRSAYRYNTNPDVGGHNIGFRVLCEGPRLS
ncbi:MAG: formylglycine-generating enzyme family protein [Cyanobacteriota bacterium]|jgi:formylglycine-generating enzyme required for sulfatase activity